jgi:hypothetical protein
MNAINTRLLWICLMLNSAAQAQTELLTNVDFATDISGWTIENGRPAIWDSRDSADNPASGSALLSNVGVSNGAVPLTLTQCVRVNAGTDYGYGGTVLVPSGQPEQTEAHVFIQAYTTPDCLGEVIQFDSVASVAVDTWLAIGGTLFTSNAASSVRVSLGVRKPGGIGADAQALFDQIYLQRTDGGGLINERLSGSWFNPATPGQGFFLDISPDLNLFFGGWFTWTGNPGEIDWMTVQVNYSGNVAVVPIFRSTGGRFNDSSPVSTTAIGIAEFSFTSCTEGQVRVEFIGSGAVTVIPLQRITPPFPGC